VSMARIGLLAAAAWMIAAPSCAQDAAAPPSAPPSSAAVAPATSARALPATQALFDSYVRRGLMPGIVGAFGAGDAPTTFVRAGTIADADAARVPAADADSLWRIYSMTKPVTAMAAMILIEEGRIGLDQPVADFIPQFRSMRVLTDPANSLASRPAARPITIRHLLTHTAGLGYTIITKGPLLRAYEQAGLVPAQLDRRTEAQARTTRPATLKEFAERAAAQPLIADPGTTWRYSIALDVLGRVIEVASGQPFDAFLRARIFEPLGMRSTGFTVSPGDVRRLATNYVYLGATRVAVDPGATSVFLTPPSFPYGGAGLVSSARDYDRFLHMIQDGGILDGRRILKPETVRLATSDLLPPGVVFSGIAGGTGGTSGAQQGYGAGGSVTLSGPMAGIYGWGGAAGTVAWVNPGRRTRGTVMVNYMPPERVPLRAEVAAALATDLAGADGRARR